MKLLTLAILLIFSTTCHSGSIGFGTVVGVKQYDLGENKTVTIYLSPNATSVNESCVNNGIVFGHITPSKHDEATMNRMFSLATAAYMSDKRLRLHSNTNSCEVDFVALQESVF
ncbi:hypothetical protein [Shewanella nanhaiensis]|uniref:TRL-like family protein n=1 Tax=Shewanella nanhaiensis TaxID=2864872 RepID=A0ABS7E2A4_9GAMM|nr:hypothetical protein [Shewanella nanhaiensis]MBW8183478.1 hypothetical protein [Shewanella nanhaiensis]